MNMILKITLKLGMYFYFPRLRDLYPIIIYSKYNVKWYYFNVKRLLNLLALGLIVSDYAGMQKSLFWTIFFWFNNNFSIILPIFLFLISPILYKLIFKAVYSLVNHYFNKRWDFYSISSTSFYYFNYIFLSIWWVFSNYMSSYLAKVDLYFLFKVLVFILVLITLLIMRFSLGKKIKDKIVSILFKYKKDKSTFVSLIISKFLIAKYILFVNFLLYFSLTGECSYTLIGGLVFMINNLPEMMTRLLKNTIFWPLWPGDHISILYVYPTPDLVTLQEHIQKKTKQDIFYVERSMIRWTGENVYYLNEFFNLNAYSIDKIALCIENNKAYGIRDQNIKNTKYSPSNLNNPNANIKGVDTFDIIGKDVNFNSALNLVHLYGDGIYTHAPWKDNGNGTLLKLTSPRHPVMPYNNLIYITLYEGGPMVLFDCFNRSHYSAKRYYIKNQLEQEVYHQLYNFRKLAGFNGGINKEQLGSVSEWMLLKRKNGIIVSEKGDTPEGILALAKFNTVDRPRPERRG